MKEPIAKPPRPERVTLDAGTYFWCACGQSKRQPFCDGSHKGSGISPVRFSVESKRPVVLCGCKQTANGPFCDGTHIGLNSGGIS